MSPLAPRLGAMVLAAAVLLAPACSDDDDGGTAPVPTLLVEAGFGSQVGTVTVSDDGVAVVGASVDVNGMAAVAGGVPGEYGVNLGAPVAGGGTITVEVSDAGAVVLAETTVPHTPVITAPAQDAVFATTQGIEVTWTSASDPDRWVVEASDGVVETFAVPDGTARAYTIPGGTLSADIWEVRVIAYNDGAVSGDTEAGSAMEVAVAVAASPTVIVVEPVLVGLQAFDPDGGSVVISQGGVPVDGATVTVNGVAAVQGGAGQNYDVVLNPPVAVGEDVELHIAFEDVVIEGLTTVAPVPVVTAPPNGAALSAADPIEVTWTSTADAAGGWAVSMYDGVSTAGLFVPDPAARAAAFAAGAVPVGDPYELLVYAFSGGTLTGPVAANSTMNVRSVSAAKTGITVTP